MPYSIDLKFPPELWSVNSVILKCRSAEEYYGGLRTYLCRWYVRYCFLEICIYKDAPLNLYNFCVYY